MDSRIAIVQFKIKQFDLEQNLSRASNFMKQASHKNADIILFPEQFLTGPVGSKVEFADSNSHLRNYLADMAREHEIFLAAGTILERVGSRIYNRAYLFDPKGKVVGHYDKMNLWASEQGRVTPGNKTKVFKTSIGRIGFAVCWDLANEQLFHSMHRQKVDLVLCPSIWWAGSESKGRNYDTKFASKFIDALCLSRAYASRAFVAYSNFAGKTNFGSFSDKSAGHSQVAAPFSGKMHSIPGYNEKMFMQDMNADICKHARAYFG